MPNRYKSPLAGGKREDVLLSKEQMLELLAPIAQKYYWFLSKGYSPHVYQIFFHAMMTNGQLTRFRALAAGRRGGKTLSAAWEVLFYALFPEVFHMHAHGKVSDKHLWIWVLTKSHKAGRPTLIAFREVLHQAGLKKNVDYKENLSLSYFEFPDKSGEYGPNSTLVEFKSAEDPESLRGSGLDILWIDEAAFIPSDEAWTRVRPALSDKLGLVIATTTPLGTNWLWDQFWSPSRLARANIGSVEYTSIDSPYFHKEEWEEAKATMHPMIFKQEYMASFLSFQGIALQGEWLHYFDEDDLPRDENDSNKLALRLFMGVDPAVSLADTADQFSMCLLGVTLDNLTVYVLEQFTGRIPFPEQVEKIQEWHLRYRPELIGVENTAYQQALVQQLQRLQSFPPIVPQPAVGKKEVRILAMAPQFRIERVLVRKTNVDFIEQWINYDPSLKNPKDDCLDAVEIGLRTAGILLPVMPDVTTINPNDMPAADIDALALRDLPREGKSNQPMDEHMGEMW